MSLKPAALMTTFDDITEKYVSYRDKKAAG